MFMQMQVDCVNIYIENVVTSLFYSFFREDFPQDDLETKEAENNEFVR